VVVVFVSGVAVASGFPSTIMTSFNTRERITAKIVKTIKEMQMIAASQTNK
jgi:hypothetical protein